MNLVIRHKLVSLIVIILVAAGFFAFVFSKSFKAKADSDLWKNFSENVLGLSIDYPAGWSLDIGYDRYAKGLANVDLGNKKCGFNAKSCAAECVDIKILIGKKPEGGSAQGLFAQLYEDFMMFRDFSSDPIVTVLDIGQKKVFKVADEASTLALNGICPGPLYVFETDSGYFAYVFAGYGTAASGNAETVEKIISSIKLN